MPTPSELKAVRMWFEAVLKGMCPQTQGQGRQACGRHAAPAGCLHVLEFYVKCEEAACNLTSTKRMQQGKPLKAQGSSDRSQSK